MTASKPNYLSKASSPNISHCRLEFQHMNFGRTKIQSIAPSNLSFLMGIRKVIDFQFVQLSYCIVENDDVQGL